METEDAVLHFPYCVGVNNNGEVNDCLGEMKVRLWRRTWKQCENVEIV